MSLTTFPFQWIMSSSLEKYNEEANVSIQQSIPVAKRKICRRRK